MSMLSRRDFLKHSALIALAPTVPGFLAEMARAAKPGRDSRILVVVQLDGGNDGINTVVPFADEGYAKHRHVLRLPSSQLIKVTDSVALHPALIDAGKLLESGRFAIVPGVGYPNPNRSHFASMAIWYSARFDSEDHNGLGWIGRALDGVAGPARNGPASVFIGSGLLPAALPGRRAVAASLARPDDFLLPAGMRLTGVAAPTQNLAAFVQRIALDAYATADRMAEVARLEDSGSRYPATELAGHLRLTAQLIKANFGARVYYARQGGYDTHGAQLGAHAALLGEFAGAVRAFLDDLATGKLAERVTLLAFSEFGRTVKENGSAGTDHGTSGPVFLAGSQVRAGLQGNMPSLLDLDPQSGELRVGTDFRRVYATVLEDWMGLESKPVLGGDFESLPLFRS
jgi:uncharacterized protein (DUF1501 family)